MLFGPSFWFVRAILECLWPDETALSTALLFDLSVVVPGLPQMLDKLTQPGSQLLQKPLGARVQRFESLVWVILAPASAGCMSDRYFEAGRIHVYELAPFVSVSLVDA